MKQWILAIYLNGSNKKGITGKQLAAEIRVSEPTAWFMLHRIRKMLQPKEEEQMEGVIMSDETFVGGKNKNRHIDKKVKNSQGRSFKDKVPVLGLMQAGGNIRCFVMQDTSKEDIQPLIHGYVKKGSTLVSDEWKGYNDLEEHYDLQRVMHNKKQYKTECGFSTNAVEGFWSHLKRTIFGVYHNVSKKHLQKYVDEIAYRFNTREMKSGERFAFTMQRINTRLTYKQLINGKGY